MSGKLTRRDVIKQGAAVLAAYALKPPLRLEAATRFDLVIRGGTILDGTGGQPWSADLGIVGDTIQAIGTISAEQGATTIDAAGKMVSPGFIDIHSHSDWSILRYPTAPSRVHDGITTEVTGNCGSSVAPIWGPARERVAEDLLEDDEIELTWEGVAGYFETMEKLGISVNQALLVGQGSLRRASIGLEDRQPSEDERRLMARKLIEALDEGAFGLSTGLGYVPGLFTPTDEIIFLAGVVARRNGLYASHIRNEEGGLLGAVHEAIETGRQSGARVEISHLKSSGPSNWSNQRAALDLIASARAAGVQVLADAYPYTAYSTGLLSFLPAWAGEGGWDAAVERLGDPAQRSRIRDEMDESVINDLGSWNLVVIASVREEANRKLVGKNLEEIADLWSVEPEEAALRLLELEDGSVSIVGHAMSQENVEMVLSHPLVMVGSDGGSIAPEGPAGQARPHPRHYGTCARVLGHFVRERELMGLATAVRKMTSMPADQVGLVDRGRIARGKKADLVVFDAAKVRDAASFAGPHRTSKGIDHVFVNGTAVVSGGGHTGARPGRALRKG
jgi:N-acyl-D-amino-acid deacylase